MVNPLSLGGAKAAPNGGERATLSKGSPIAGEFARRPAPPQPSVAEPRRACYARSARQGETRLRMIGVTAAVLLAGCAAGPDVATGACANPDGALDDAAFVIAEAPLAGARVSSGFAVSGCSRTFESTVNWRLLARDGRVLNQDFATGGSVAERQIGHLEVFEVDASDGEGNPPGRTVLPLVLQP
jgi:hypothetical protein